MRHDEVLLPRIGGVVIEASGGVADGFWTKQPQHRSYGVAGPQILFDEGFDW